jgi:Xaa-Pro aminopeptidase
MSDRGVEALLITNIRNVFYLSGFTGSTAAMIVTGSDSHVLVDPRYSIQARNECRTAEVHDYTGKSTIAAAAELANDLAPSSLGYESDHLTVTSLRSLRKALERSIGLRGTHRLVERVRQVKDAQELSLIRRAAEIADETLTAVLSEIKPGITEKQVALLIDSTLRILGADKEAFETIAAAGPNSACPHASPTDTVLQSGQFLKMDFGARYANYNSDITRTVCLGDASEKQREVYQIVLDAQIKAIEAIAPGKTGREIDAVARDYIASKGYGDNFGHGLGHALGIEVHDGPGFSVTSDIVLEPGMVMTVEPGIYIEGWGGVRIEDDIVVTDSGAEIITSSPKELRRL